MKRSLPKFSSKLTVRLRTYGALKALACLCGLAVGCGKTTAGNGQQFQIPWPDSEGIYHLKNVTLNDYTHPESLQGSDSKVIVNPKVEDGKLKSDTPVGHYIHTKNNLNVPADYVTLQATTINAHFEKLTAMDRALDISLSWPLRIAIQSNLVDQGETIRNNAVYDQDLDALMIVPFTETTLPIAANAGILAHEHFHAIFQSLVLNQLVDDPRMHRMGCNGAVSTSGTTQSGAQSSDSNTAVPPTGPIPVPWQNPESEDQVATYNMFFLRAINEGLADFWGWVYTGNPDFISVSLPSEKERRRVDRKLDQLKSSDALTPYVRNVMGGKAYPEAQIIGNAYVLGTDYARSMHEIAIAVTQTEKPDFEARLTIAKALIASLPQIASDVMSAQSAKRRISPNIVLKNLYGHLPSVISASTTGSIAPACDIIHRLAAPEARSFVGGYMCGSTPQPSPTPKDSK